MKHLDEKVLDTFLEGQENDSDLDHFLECNECRSKLIENMFPNSNESEVLTGDERETLFNEILGSINETQEDSSKKIARFPKISFWYGMGGMALAASLLLFLLPMYIPNQSSETFVKSIFNGEKENGAQNNTYSFFVNNKEIIGDVTLETGKYSIKTEDKLGNVKVGPWTEFVVDPNSTCEMTIKNNKNITLELAGGIQGAVEHGKGVSLSIKVNGGQYRIVGTIFTINSNRKGSNIYVKEGKVIFEPSIVGLQTDTISTGEYEEYLISNLNTNKKKINQIETVIDTNISVDTFAYKNSKPESNKVIFNLIQQAKKLIISKKADQALALLKSIETEQDFNQNELIFNIGLTYEALGKRDSANQKYQHIIDFGDRDQWQNEAYNKLYKKSIEQGKTEQYRFLLNWAKNHLLPQEPLYHLATLERENSNFNSAVKFYGEYIQRYGQNGEHIEEAYWWISQSYKELGLSDAYAKYASRYQNQYPNGKWIKEFQK